MTYAALVLSLVACGGEELQTVRGAIVDVQQSSPFELGSLDLMDESGAVLRFEARGYQGFTPSHLIEHMVQGLPISVTYRRGNGALVIVEIAD